MLAHHGVYGIKMSKELELLLSFEEITFTSEIGQDTYYLWYTYFLKKRYAHDNYEA